MVEGDVELYQAVRGQIEHESSLVGVRLGWLITAEAFLAAAYATVLTVSKESTKQPLSHFLNQAHRLFVTLPIVGMVSVGNHDSVNLDRALGDGIIAQEV